MDSSSLLNEHRSYHALAVHFESNYAKLTHARTTHGSWSAASAAIGAGESRASHIRDLWTKLEAKPVRLILRDDPEYPALLREIPHPPHGLYVRGVLPSEKKPLLAIVGTRKVTPAGKELTERFARALAEGGCGIVSGLALGADAAAHKGALAGGDPTIAVLATGPDLIYPSFNEHLARNILEAGGTILSEYPPGSPALPYRFLERNRIVSGLAQGVLVIEAPERSGSLATARFAVEQNRMVFVVPGPVAHPNFIGSHALIRAGAELVTKPDDILESFGLAKNTTSAPTIEPENEEERSILDALRKSSTPLEIDKISEHTNLEAHVVNQTIGFLIIRNLVTETSNGYTVHTE